MIGLLGVIGFALINADSLPAWIVAMAPIPPLPFVAAGALATHIAQIRGITIDTYETEIRTLSRELDHDSDFLAPYGHTILNRRVWQGYYARVAASLLFLTCFPIYLAVLIEAYRESHEKVPALARASLIGCSFVTAVSIVLFVVALFPRREFERGLAQLRALEQDAVDQDAGR